MPGLSITPGLNDGIGLAWLSDGLGSGGLTIGVAFNTVLPEISGTPQVGEDLTVTPGTWTGYEPIVLTYQWYADGVAIDGETAETLTLGAEQEGTMITVVETATNAVGSTPATSAAVGPVAPA